MVPLKAVKAWRVVEPKARRSEEVVAPPLIVRPVPAVPPPTVLEALELKPPKRWRMVEVDWSLPNLVKGNGKETEAQPEQEVTVRLPRFATFARRLVEEAR